MFARLLMFSLVVFFANSAFAEKDFQPRISNDRRIEEVMKN